MLYAMLAVCAALIFVLPVPHAAQARRSRRLFRTQEEWAEMMDRHEEEKEDVAVVCKCSDLSTPS